MKHLKIFLLIFLSGFLASCMHQSETENAQITPEPVVTQQIDDNQENKNNQMADDSMDNDMMGKENMMNNTTKEEQDLIDSPRHHEWVEVDNNGKTIHTWVVYPEVSENATTILLIHENRGLTDWVRSLADQVAAEGYIAVAPDLLSEYNNIYSRTSDFESEDAARDALYTLKDEDVLGDLLAVEQYAKNLSASNGKLASAGFCWGGSKSFQLAAETQNLDAALVFYGTGPENANTYEGIDVPVYGFYGGDDQRVNSTIEQSQAYMQANNNMYNYEIYPEAGHAFMRLGEQADASDANAQARSQSWERMKMILDNLE